MEKHTFNIKKIEVEFPHFRKYEFFYYKVLNTAKEIRIEYHPSPDETLESYAISYDRICEANTFREGSYEITEDEFNETFKRALALINDKK